MAKRMAWLGTAVPAASGKQRVLILSVTLAALPSGALGRVKENGREIHFSGALRSSLWKARRLVQFIDKFRKHFWEMKVCIVHWRGCGLSVPPPGSPCPLLSILNGSLSRSLPLFPVRFGLPFPFVVVVVAMQGTMRAFV